MRLSFIIPVYNCAECLSRCIESIMGIECDYEIILINDGSEDDSLSVCKSYEDRYDFIKVIDQSNRGTSAARNRGLDIAQGEYVWFVDADDRIDASIIPGLIDAVKDNPEVICFNYKSISVDGEVNNEEWKHRERLDGIAFLEGMHTMYLWNKIYRRDIIVHKRFVDGTKNIEDMYFNLCVIPYIQSIAVIPENGYFYVCISNNSTSRNLNPRNLIKLSQDSLAIQEHIINDIKQTNDEKTKRVLNKYLNLSLLGHIFSLVRFYDMKRLGKTIDIYKNWNVYPIGKTNNKKANLFAIVVNNRVMLYVFFYCYRVVAYI